MFWFNKSRFTIVIHCITVYIIYIVIILLSVNLTILYGENWNFSTRYCKIIVLLWVFLFTKALKLDKYPQVFAFVNVSCCSSIVKSSKHFLFFIKFNLRNKRNSPASINVISALSTCRYRISSFQTKRVLHSHSL